MLRRPPFFTALAFSTSALKLLFLTQRATKASMDDKFLSRFNCQTSKHSMQTLPKGIGSPPGSVLVAAQAEERKQQLQHAQVVWPLEPLS